jgi:hypothetical protein
MSPLHISKVAVGCANLEALRRRQAARAAGGVVPIYTRFRPKRADELVGGSIYWIIKHNVAARQMIVSFDVDAESRKTIIRLDAGLVRVAPQPRRAHQGWRYLGAEDAQSDLDGSSNALAALPPALITQLASLALI